MWNRLKRLWKKLIARECYIYSSINELTIQQRKELDTLFTDIDLSLNRISKKLSKLTKELL